MKYPWEEEEETGVWKAFCNEKGWYFESDKELFKESRSLKEEYEWFKKGYLHEK